MKLIYVVVLMFVGVKTSAQTCSVEFEMTGSGNACGTGIFTVKDFTGTENNIGDASSGFAGTANSSEFQTAKDIGALPEGKYRIVLENDEKNTFRLHPMPGTEMHDRNGMLIHGYGLGQSRQEASQGCIILDRNQRNKLQELYNECGELRLTVTFN